MLRSGRLWEVLGLGSLLVLVPLATLGSTLVVCELSGLSARAAEVLGASLGLLATVVVAVALVLSARRARLAGARLVGAGTSDDPLRVRVEVEELPVDELPVWVGRASEVGVRGGLLLVAGSVLAQVAVSISAALDVARAGQVAAGYVVLLATVSAGAALLVRVRWLERRDAARVAAEMGRAVPGLDVAPLAAAVYDQRWHRVARLVALRVRLGGGSCEEQGDGSRATRVLGSVALVSLAQVAGLSDLRTGRVAAAVDAALAVLDGRPGGLDVALRAELATLSDCLVLDGEGVSLDEHGPELAAVRVLLAALAALTVDAAGRDEVDCGEGSPPPAAGKL